MQDALFPDATPHEPSTAALSPQNGQVAKGKGLDAVRAAPPNPAHLDMAAALHPLLRLGTSSWTYPGWAGLVWDGEVSEPMLAKHGLHAYAQHPLLRTVSVDRAFYRALSTAQYARYAAQVPEDFRFVVKAPSAVADAMVRSEQGRGLQPNPVFLNPQLAVDEFVQPALDGLGRKLGALVFQLSPLPAHLLRQLPEVLARLREMLHALPALRPIAPDGVIAVEVRDPALLTPDLAQVLREAGATYCLGLHAKMPAIADQLPMLRALWPGPLVCRWNLNRLHGAYGYEAARDLYSPYDQIHDSDEETRHMLAKVIAGTTAAGQLAYVTLSNKAEGCAPKSVDLLAQAVLALQS